jgi:hypothetical protein
MVAGLVVSPGLFSDLAAWKVKLKAETRMYVNEKHKVYYSTVWMNGNGNSEFVMVALLEVRAVARGAHDTAHHSRKQLIGRTQNPKFEQRLNKIPSLTEPLIGSIFL